MPSLARAWCRRFLARWVAFGCFLVIAVFVSGCAALPWPFFGKKKEAEVAVTEATATPNLPPAAAAPSPTPRPDPRKPPPRTGWKKWLLFWWPQRPLPPPAAQALTPVGRIFLVNAPANFVLIETPNARQIPVGEQLHTLQDGNILATVKVSAQRNPPFVVADIVKGLPRAGDRVYPVVLGDQPAAPHAPTSPASGESPQPSASANLPVVEPPLPVQSDAEVDRLPPIEDLLR